MNATSEPIEEQIAEAMKRVPGVMDVSVDSAHRPLVRVEVLVNELRRELSHRISDAHDALEASLPGITLDLDVRVRERVTRTDV